MNKLILTLLLLVAGITVYGQNNDSQNLQMVTERGEFSADDIHNILQFQGIYYYKQTFTGSDLAGKSYIITAREFRDGELIQTDTLVNSSTILINRLQTINDTTFTITVICQQVEKNKMKMDLRFPIMGTEREFNTMESTDYALKNLLNEENQEIEYGKPFPWLGYILPYDRGDGWKSWCDVANSGSDFTKWGERFRIPHYIIFEMTFE